jgi:hypothetical protein
MLRVGNACALRLRQRDVYDTVATNYTKSLVGVASPLENRLSRRWVFSVGDSITYGTLRDRSKRYRKIILKIYQFSA